jgi:hypothetical protein
VASEQSLKSVDPFGIGVPSRVTKNDFTVAGAATPVGGKVAQWDLIL